MSNKPDFENWWAYFRQGCRYVECEVSTMKIVKGWKSHNLAEITKTDPHNILVTINSYFGACLNLDEWRAVHGKEAQQ